MEIVRYDRAGKWFLEPTNPYLKRQRVTIKEAASQAIWAAAHGGDYYLGLPGGGAFDRYVSGERS